MSSALYFLLVVALVAVVGSLLLSLWSKRRQLVDPPFAEQLEALAPLGGSQTRTQTTGIVHLEDEQPEENSTGTRSGD